MNLLVAFYFVFLVFFYPNVSIILVLSDNNSNEYFPSNSLNPDCSGRGIVILNECHCDPGWSGIGDMINRDNIDCNINITVVRVLHSIWLFLVLIGASLAIIKLSRASSAILTHTDIHSSTMSITRGTEILIHNEFKEFESSVNRL